MSGATTESNLMSFLHPPFNKVSNYRDPGRVNINTIARVRRVRNQTQRRDESIQSAAMECFR